MNDEHVNVATAVSEVEAMASMRTAMTKATAAASGNSNSNSNGNSNSNSNSNSNGSIGNFSGISSGFGSMSNSSSPSSMSGMPDHLRPPSISVVGKNSNNQMTSETPITQAMRLVGAHSHSHHTRGSARSSTSTVSPLTPASNNFADFSPLNQQQQQRQTEQREQQHGSGTSAATNSVSAGVDLSYGVANFHNLDRSNQREVMKQLIEKEIVERVGDLSVSEKEDSKLAAPAAGTTPAGNFASSLGELDTLNSFSPRLSNFLNGGESGLSSGMTPRGMEGLEETPKVGSGNTDKVDKRILQEAVTAAARAIARPVDDGLDEVFSMIMTPLGMSSSNTNNNNDNNNFNNINDVNDNNLNNNNSNSNNNNNNNNNNNISPQLPDIGADDGAEFDLDEYTRNLLLDPTI